MEFRQTHPSPGLAPDFRWDLDGRASFLHEGFQVNVQVRQATSDDVAYYLGTQATSDDVVITGTITLEGIEVAEASHGALISEPHTMNVALFDVLREAVEDARRDVAKLVQRIAEIDSRAVLDAVNEGDTYEVDHFPEGLAPTEGKHVTGRELRNLLSKFRAERWAVSSTPEGLKAQRGATSRTGAQVYELRRIDTSKEVTQ